MRTPSLTEKSISILRKAHTIKKTRKKTLPLPTGIYSKGGLSAEADTSALTFLGAHSRGAYSRHTGDLEGDAYMNLDSEACSVQVATIEQKNTEKALCVVMKNAEESVNIRSTYTLHNILVLYSKNL